MIRFEDYTMPAASMGAQNPLPDIKNVSYIHAGYEMTDNISAAERAYIGKGMISTMLPYKMQDGYDRNKQMRAFKAAVLENDCIKAVFLPEFGGRLWSLFDKRLGKELLYVNPVFQPGNLGLRNAWFSGGVEFNVGIKGHNPLTCAPMWCAVDETPQGEVLRLYEYERIRGVVYSISAYLPEDSAVLYIKGSIENATDEQKHMYWWSNIAVPEQAHTRVLVPAKESFLSFYNEDHYLIDKVNIPMCDGADVSYPENLTSSRDFFYKIPETRHKWIAAAQQDGTGLLQCSTQKLKGRKLFVWGQGQGGRNWGEWLSVEGSSYIEIQAGLAHTQMEHIPMPARTTWEWVEAYTALEAAPEVLCGAYDDAVAAAEQALVAKVGNSDTLTFPDTVTSSKIIMRGADWGALEEAVRGEKISKLCRFEREENGESAIWWDLLTENNFPCPDTAAEPESYVVSAFWKNRLENLPAQNWYSLLQLGVTAYALGDTAGAQKAWEASVEAQPSAWALRNLCMLYKNEYKDMAKAIEYMLFALSLKGDCLPMLCEAAALLCACGKYAQWLDIYEALPETLKAAGRLRYYKALALMETGALSEATKILNADFVLNDVKEGELSVSQLWFMLYRRLYAFENGLTYDENDVSLQRAADAKYPLPRKLDFRMHD